MQRFLAWTAGIFATGMLLALVSGLIFASRGLWFADLQQRFVKEIAQPKSATHLASAAEFKPLFRVENREVKDLWEVLALLERNELEKAVDLLNQNSTITNREEIQNSLAEENPEQAIVFARTRLLDYITFRDGLTTVLTYTLLRDVGEEIGIRFPLLRTDSAIAG